MPLLKSQSSHLVVKDAIVLDMGDIDQEAKRIIAETRREAAQIVEEARREAAKLVAEAAGLGRGEGLERGLAEGREQGRKEGRAAVIEELKPQLQALFESWKLALERWETDRAEMLLAARQDVLAFALEMGSKVALRVIEADASVVADQLAEALGYLTKPTAVAITTHPADRTLVEEVLPELISRFSLCTHASIRDDPSMQRGGCMIATGNGKIDGSIETQIEQIVNALLPKRVEMENR